MYLEIAASLRDKIPDGRIGDWEITREHGPLELRQHYYEVNQTWMSTVRWEQGSHRVLEEKARGDVLIAGLGLGIDVKLCEAIGRVDRITVVESEEDVGALVWPWLETRDSTVLIHHHRILKFMQTTAWRFDVIWFDIFPNDPIYFPDAERTLREAADRILKPCGDVLFWRTFPKMMEL